MEPRLIIFLGFTALALIINTGLIFAAYKMFAAMSKKVTDSAHEFTTSMQTREWISRMHSASEVAVKTTENLKGQIAGFEPTIQRIHETYTESLLKADARLGLLCRATHFAVGVADRFVTWPIHQVNSAAGGLQGIFSFIRGSENGGNARSRRKR